MTLSVTLNGDDKILKGILNRSKNNIAGFKDSANISLGGLVSNQITAVMSAASSGTGIFVGGLALKLAGSVTRSLASIPAAIKEAGSSPRVREKPHGSRLRKCWSNRPGVLLATW